MCIEQPLTWVGWFRLRYYNTPCQNCLAKGHPCQILGHIGQDGGPNHKCEESTLGII